MNQDMRGYNKTMLDPIDIPDYEAPQVPSSEKKVLPGGKPFWETCI